MNTKQSDYAIDYKALANHVRVYFNKKGEFKWIATVNGEKALSYVDSSNAFVNAKDFGLLILIIKSP